MTTKNEALRLALEALEWFTAAEQGDEPPINKTITAIKQALEQPEPEPTIEDNSQNWRGMDGAIAWHLIERHADNWSDIRKMMTEWLDANRNHPVREPLTDEQIDALREANSKGRGAGWSFNFKGFARAIEAAHGIKGDAP